MRHTDIQAGDRLKLKPDNGYGLEPAVYTVSFKQPRDGYTVPFIACESHRPERGILFFRPQDFQRHAREGEL